MRIFIDGRTIENRDDFFAAFGRQISLPDYFGNNLDALSDLLCEQAEPVTIEIIFFQELAKNLGGPFAGSFWRMLGDLEVKVIKHA